MSEMKHEHLTTDELKILMNYRKEPSQKNRKNTIQIRQKVFLCPDCYKRYITFMELDLVAQEYSPASLPLTISDRILNAIDDFVEQSSATLSTGKGTLVDTIRSWTENVGCLTSHVGSLFFEHGTPAYAVRGIKTSTESEPKKISVIKTDENGVFAFSVEKADKYDLYIEDDLELGDAFCAVIIGENNFEQICSLLKNQVDEYFAEGIELDEGQYYISILSK